MKKYLIIFLFFFATQSYGQYTKADLDPNINYLATCITNEIVLELDGVVTVDEVQNTDGMLHRKYIAEFTYTTPALFRMTVNRFVDKYSDVHYHNYWSKEDTGQHSTIYVVEQKGNLLKYHTVSISWIKGRDMALFLFTTIQVPTGDKI